MGFSCKQIFCVFGVPMLLCIILPMSPALHRYYIKTYAHFDHAVSPDSPILIRDAPIVEGVHTYEEVYNYLLDDEVVLFKNFTDCAGKFEQLYEENKHEIKTYYHIDYAGYTGNPLVTGYRNKTEVKSTLEKILVDEDPDVYASFLRVWSIDEIAYLLNKEDSSNIMSDSTFISFFRHNLWSAAAHAAVLGTSLSLQCVGTKKWLLWKSTTLESTGHTTTASPIGVVMGGSPASIIRIPGVKATVEPGDLLMIPPLYYHSVQTDAGKNIMMTLRILNPLIALASFKKDFSTSFVFLMRKLYEIALEKLEFSGTDWTKKGFSHENLALKPFTHNFMQHKKVQENEFGTIEWML